MIPNCPVTFKGVSYFQNAVTKNKLLNMKNKMQFHFTYNNVIKFELKCSHKFNLYIKCTRDNMHGYIT